MDLCQNFGDLFQDKLLEKEKISKLIIQSISVICL